MSLWEWKEVQEVLLMTEEKSKWDKNVNLINEWRDKNKDKIFDIERNDWRETGKMDLDRLCDQYPDIFAHRDLPASKSCMGRGICVGIGWEELLVDLCNDISLLCKHLSVMVIADQVKTKKSTGFLRFYCTVLSQDGSPKEQELRIISSVVAAAQYKSRSVCEICGKSGETGFPSLKRPTVLCNDHFAASCILESGKNTFDCMRILRGHGVIGLY